SLRQHNQDMADYHASFNQDMADVDHASFNQDMADVDHVSLNQDMADIDRASHTQASCPVPEFISADDAVRLHSSDYLITVSYMPELRDLLNEVRATVTGLKNSDYFTLQQSLDEFQRAISDGVKTHPDISVLCRKRLKKSAKMLYNGSRYMLWRGSMRMNVAGLESLLAVIPDKDLSSNGWTVPYIEGSEETEVTTQKPELANFPPTVRFRKIVEYQKTARLREKENANTKRTDSVKVDEEVD
ncbi:hypothetical protein V493_01461, partial [Pseudogymnoascus sp. VKM F-4281 (FW-2241)]